MFATLKALLAGLLADEPVLVQGVIVAIVGAVVGLVGLALTPATIAGIAAYVVATLAAALKVRSKVTPS